MAPYWKITTSSTPSLHQETETTMQWSDHSENQLKIKCYHLVSKYLIINIIRNHWNTLVPNHNKNIDTITQHTSRNLNKRDNKSSKLMKAFDEQTYPGYTKIQVLICKFPHFQTWRQHLFVAQGSKSVATLLTFT